jgi:C4-dicarboxylate transporter DctM subunit
VLIVAGLFLDAISIFYIFIPIFMPVVRELGVDPVHFGIIVTINLAIGQITPPVGVNLFVASRIGGVGLGELSRAVLPLILAEVVALLLVTFVPALSLCLL